MLILVEAAELQLGQKVVVVAVPEGRPGLVVVAGPAYLGVQSAAAAVVVEPTVEAAEAPELAPRRAGLAVRVGEVRLALEARGE
jgi:hypothetical protein